MERSALLCHFISDLCSLSSIGTNATSILGKINNDEKLEQDLNLSSAGLAAGAIFLRWLENRLDKDGDIPRIDSEHIYRSFFQHNESAMYAFYTLNTACSGISYLLSKQYSWAPLPPNFELGFNISATMCSGLGKVCDEFSYLYKSKFLNRENRKSR